MRIYLLSIQGVMRKNSLALPRPRESSQDCAQNRVQKCVRVRFCVFMVFFFAAGNFLPAQGIHTGDIPSSVIYEDEIRWYRSNSSGMTLVLIPSHLAAMESYSLSIRAAVPAEIPELVLPHFNSAYRIELRTLYQEGRPIRYQWTFRDGRGMTRVAATGRGSRFATRTPNPLVYDGARENLSSGIIELRNNEGDVTREFQFSEDLSEWDFRYFYRDGILIRAEIWFKEPPAPEGDPAPAVPRTFNLVFTDLYRYTRSGSLRAIDRTVHAGALERSRLSFPRLGPGASLGENLIGHGGAHTAEHFTGIQASENIMISYNLDIRGRVLGEVWRDEEGEVFGELVNTWVGDRLHSMLWRSEGYERLTEFEYDSEGNRIAERNFRNGMLERSVITQGNTDIEEVFVAGRLILRAVWKDGVRVSEDWISPAPVRGGRP